MCHELSCGCALWNCLPPEWLLWQDVGERDDSVSVPCCPVAKLWGYPGQFLGLTIQVCEAPGFLPAVEEGQRGLLHFSPQE